MQGIKGPKSSFGLGSGKKRGLDSLNESVRGMARCDDEHPTLQPQSLGQGEGVPVRDLDYSDGWDFESDEDFDCGSIPSDTFAAMLSLRREFYGTKQVTGGEDARTGVVLQHQIYTVLGNRTAVDLELTDMRSNSTVRLFRLNTGKDDYGVMGTEQYHKLVRRWMGFETPQPIVLLSPRRRRPVNIDNVSFVYSNCGQITKVLGQSLLSPPNGGTLVDQAGCGKVTVKEQVSLPVGDILRAILKSNTKSYAERGEVVKAIEQVLHQLQVKRIGEVSNKGLLGEKCGLSGGKSCGRVQQKRLKLARDQEEPTNVKQANESVAAVLSELVRAGFLLPRRDVGHEEAYWFFFPKMGKFVTSVRHGRIEVLAALRRTQYKEMRRDSLEKRKLAKSGLPLSFHIRDLLGLDLVRELDTPAGKFIRLV
ncbi:unnamed protein product [Choristocarpus tenellus]